MSKPQESFILDEKAFLWAGKFIYDMDDGGKKTTSSLSPFSPLLPCSRCWSLNQHADTAR